MPKLFDLVGNTPLVELNNICTKPGVKLYGKLEGNNPGGSVKDRAAYGMIKGALILSLIISIFKELLPSNNVHENWREKSYLYRKLDTLQKEYLMQYKKIK